ADAISRTGSDSGRGGRDADNATVVGGSGDDLGVTMVARLALSICRGPDAGLGAVAAGVVRRIGDCDGLARAGGCAVCDCVGGQVTTCANTGKKRRGIGLRVTATLRNGGGIGGASASRTGVNRGQRIGSGVSAVAVRIGPSDVAAGACAAGRVG